MHLMNFYGNRAGKSLDPKDNLHHLVTVKAVGQLINLANIPTNKFIVEGSVGKGRYAYIPWLAIRDRDESVASSITQGYYIVYLFRADMSGFYLSLMQGWSYYFNKHNQRVAPARAEVRSVSDHWRKELSSDISEFSLPQIDLRHSHKTPRGYEASHICGKFYPSDAVPSNSILAADLESLMKIYSKLSSKLGAASFGEYNDSIGVSD